METAAWPFLLVQALLLLRPRLFTLLMAAVAAVVVQEVVGEGAAAVVLAELFLFVAVTGGCNLYFYLGQMFM